MSMTKRYLESLPMQEQNAILGITPEEAGIDPDYENYLSQREAALGGIDNAYISPDEWTDDAENEPTEEEMREWARELTEWARTLIEEDDEELNDPPVKCRICRETRPISEMNTNGECPDCQRETALLVRPEGKCVTLADNNGVEWKL